MLLFSLYVAFAVAVDRSTASSVTPAAFLGIAPQDGEYFSSEVIYCRDGSKSFSKDLLNDDFCDCSDGTDEPGTSACPEGKFYCRNIGDEPQILFSSRVNDRICDCCDGSDEYDGVVNCQNTCKKNLGSNSKPDSDEEEEVLTSIKDLKIVAIVEFVLASVMIVYGFSALSRCRARSKRKRYYLRN